MKKGLIYIILIALSCSCNSSVKRTIINDTDKVNSNSEENQLVTIKSTVGQSQVANSTIRINANIISVEETLIMPSDYLTTAMKVKTDDNKILVFLDMFGFEKLVGNEITIEYKIIQSSSLLLCANCSTFTEEINLYDITSFPSQSVFKELKLLSSETGFIFSDGRLVCPRSLFN